MYVLHEALAREHMRQLQHDAERERLAASVAGRRARRQLALWARASASRRARAARRTARATAQ